MMMSHDPTDDERAVYEALTNEQLQRAVQLLDRILDATEVRGDHAGAALLRETLRYVQAGAQRA
jgi:hypothetical protein